MEREKLFAYFFFMGGRVLGGGGGKGALAWRGGGVAGGWRTWGVLGWVLSRRGETSKAEFQNNSGGSPGSAQGLRSARGQPRTAHGAANHRDPGKCMGDLDKACLKAQN